MIHTRNILLLLTTFSAIQAATFSERKSSETAIHKKRAVGDSYTYPLPIVSFLPEKPKKVLVEMVKSVGTNQRYLPPSAGSSASPPTNAAPKTPISVSISSFEPSAPATSTTTTAEASIVSSSQKKRPSGGLGGFKYYGGGGSSSSNTNVKTVPVVEAAPTAETAPNVVVSSAAPVKVEASAAPVPTVKTIKVNGKLPGYDYPTPKNGRKPSKKEQKLADSKPEETGYNYEVASPVSYAPAPHPAPGMMGLSYMRQSSPYYSYHVMLD